MKCLTLGLLLLGSTLAAADAPRVFSLSGPALLAARERLARGEPALQPALTALRADADRLLQARPPSVMDKPLTAASGDKHDYFSYGPYWWPDPAKPDGLPYLRRDGEINPASKQGTDDHPFGFTCEAIETLGLAYWFTGDARYAAQAARFARIWFLDPATRMNPNLDHAQAIPGITHGRGIGLIEARGLAGMTDGLALLGDSPAWTQADRAAFTTWLGTYYHWLRTSPNGRDEQKEENNHGTWYDLQAAHLALVLGQPDDAREILAAGLTSRIAREVEPGGAQPRELARTKSFGYSLFNLEALFANAHLADQVGLDWWHFTTPDGRSLQAALAYLAPYVDPAQHWPKKDLEHPNPSRLLPLFARYLTHRDEPQFRELFGKFSAQDAPGARWRLIWPAP